MTLTTLQSWKLRLRDVPKVARSHRAVSNAARRRPTLLLVPKAPGLECLVTVLLFQELTHSCKSLSSTLSVPGLC